MQSLRSHVLISNLAFGFQRRLRAQLIFLSHSIAFSLHRHLGRLSRSGVFPSPWFSYLISTAYWQRLCHTQKHYHAALWSTSWVLTLISPASPCRMVLGVAERELGYTFAQSLNEGGVERALAVCGYEKIDAIRGIGPT